MTTKITTLENGLRIVTDSIETVETVALGAWIKVGSRHETYDMNGISHMLEHMLFRGTERHTSKEIAEKIEAVGGHLNAYTAREQTGYYARILKEDVPLAVDLIADILQNSLFNTEELEREKKVVLQEISQTHDTPDDVIFDLFQETAFPFDPLGYPVIGRSEVITSFTRKNIQEYINSHYSTSNMILAAAGNIDHEKFVDLVSQKFKKIESRVHLVPEQSKYKGGDLRAQKELEQVHLILGFPSVQIDHDDYYATSLLATILGGGMSSKLFQEVREKRGLVYEIQSFINGFSDHGIFGIYASANPQQATELLPVVCEELLTSPDTITENELKRAKSQLKASLMMTLENTNARCDQLVQQIMFYGHTKKLSDLLMLIESVELERVKKIASSLFNKTLTFTAIGPIKGLENYESLSKRLSS